MASGEVGRSVSVMSNLGAVGQTRANSLAGGTGGVDMKEEQGAWMEDPWAPWHLRGGQRKSSPQRIPDRSRQPGARRACGLILEAAEVLGLSHSRVPSRGYRTHADARVPPQGQQMGAQNQAFLPPSQVMPMEVVSGLHFDKLVYGECQDRGNKQQLRGAEQPGKAETKK